jgi:DNA-binding transcriptional regulator YdaS (Cro superfamily)
MSTVMQDPGPSAALKDAITRYGGNAALAKSLDISRPAVAQWEVCPALRVLQVEALTGVSRHLLRPDLYPRDLA